VPADKAAIQLELLVVRARRGDPGAQAEIIRRWERRLLYYIRRLVESEEDAWDILQETWLKALRALPTLRDARSLPVWLYRIARCTAMSHLRKRYRRQEVFDEGAKLPEVEGETVDFQPEDAARVHQALDRISLAHREVLTLHFLEELSVEEIAAVLGAPSGTVKSRLHYARRALRAVMEEDEP
jgi:RNA polymerase sigma-70 factor, ECF subfamily